MKSSIALAILTYVDACRPAEVRRRLPDAIDSLERSTYQGPVFIVDDGSTCEMHRSYLDELEQNRGYEVIRRPRNGGISRAKNTCLRVIRDAGADVGFLAEDDALFYGDWHEAYDTSMRASKIQHFSWYLEHSANRTIVCNQAVVTITACLLGLMMTFTREVLDTVGGFKVLPHRYGFEHINWTYRVSLAGLAPFGADIVNSSRYIRRNTHPSSVPELEIREGAAMNQDPAYKFEQLYEPLSE